MPSAHPLLLPDGQTLTVWQWPQQEGRPTLHWAHATGFSARTYSSLLDRLAEHLNIVAWDMRGHGDSRDAGHLSSFRGWPTYYDDLAAVLEQYSQPVWLAGHSIGGMTSLAAATRVPRRVAGILLVEPVIFSGLPTAVLRISQATRLTSRLSFVSAAANRRSRFVSAQAAFDAYRVKKVFRSWPDSWLQAYIRYGFVESADGRIELACRPAWEARTFALTEHRPWRGLHRLPEGLPVRVLAAERRSTIPPRARRLLQKHLPQAEIRQLPNSSHFLPMEYESVVADWIQQQIQPSSV